MVLGKSTLAKIISGLEVPNKGQVVVDGINTSNKKEFLSIRKKVGVVFQNPENQILFNNVFDDIAFTLKNLEIDNYKEKIENSLEKLNMKEFLNSESYDLSLGQKQRVTIAGVVSAEPKYIVLDEPTTMIDPEGKEAVYSMIKSLKEQNYTIIYITNFIDEILMSDKIIVLEDGKIINTFAKKDILDNIEFLKEHGIKIPYGVEIVYELKKNGIDLKIENWDKNEIINKFVGVAAHGDPQKGNAKK
ncbi:MAG: ATP-binding cassette domain-containing protein [Clostridia bacterium]|nr:ATP-binding cassette domain-containing protein [Clostridia bacterium]